MKRKMRDDVISSVRNFLIYVALLRVTPYVLKKLDSIWEEDCPLTLRVWIPIIGSDESSPGQDSTGANFLGCQTDSRTARQQSDLAILSCVYCLLFCLLVFHNQMNVILFWINMVTYILQVNMFTTGMAIFICALIQDKECLFAWLSGVLILLKDVICSNDCCLRISCNFFFE